MGRQRGRGDLVGNRREWLNKIEVTPGNSILITTHLVRCNGQRVPEYPAQKPMDHAIIFQLMVGDGIKKWCCDLYTFFFSFYVFVHCFHPSR